VLGHRAEVFRSASAYLEWLGREAPDHGFLEIRTPGMDGVALLERIRERGLHFPVVALTGYPGDELAREVRDLGAPAGLTKSVSMDRLQVLLEVAA
jgi:two-component system response regulator YesN